MYVLCKLFNHFSLKKHFKSLETVTHNPNHANVFSGPGIHK